MVYNNIIPLELARPSPQTRMMNKGLFLAIQAALLHDAVLAGPTSSGEAMHHMMNPIEYGHYSDHHAVHPVHLIEEDNATVVHTTHPVHGYYELEHYMDIHPEFPLEMYIPLYYDTFKAHYGWEYADLIQQCIYEGHTHDREHEIYWPAHVNEIDENFSLAGLGSAFGKFGQAAKSFGSQMMGKMPSWQSLSQGASQLWSKMPNMQTMMQYGQNLYGLGQQGFETFCKFQPNNPQCQSGSLGQQIMGQGGALSGMVTPQGGFNYQGAPAWMGMASKGMGYA